jgi:CRISPR-associated protein Cas1
MIKKIIEISQAKTHLAIRYGQLIIRQGPPTGEQSEQQLGAGFKETSIPCEDIGVLLVDHSGVTYTHSVFTELLRCGAAVVLCGGDHHPTGMLLPIESNTVQAERFREQIEAKEPVKKKLWQQIVRAKIKHQAKLVGKDSSVYKALMALRDNVRSGDPDNIEAQASKRFWAVYIQGMDSTSSPQGFHRNVEGRAPNNMLNYGYMVMRAAVARALCSAGLLPSLGIHHRNRYNAFCLADDMIEPFRGFVEAKVRDICAQSGVPDELSQSIKAAILEVLYEEVKIGEFAGPLMVGLHRTAASLQRCFAGEQKELELPEV